MARLRAPFFKVWVGNRGQQSNKNACGHLFPQKNGKTSNQLDLITYACVCHPTTRFDLIGIQAPVLQLLLKKWTANVCWIMEFSCAVVIEDLSKNSRMSIEKVFVENGIVIAKGFCEATQSRGGNFLQCSLVGFMANSTTIQNAPVFGIHFNLQRFFEGCFNHSFLIWLLISSKSFAF